MRKTIALIFTVIIMTACSVGDGCIEDLTMSMKATFYKMTYDNSIEQFTPEKVSQSVILFGLGRDSLLYDHNTTSSINIPLQKFDSVSSFVLGSLINGSLIYDTIDFYHANETKFISLDCGCIVKNHLTGVSQTNHMIDSIVIEYPLVDLESKNNIKIYLKNK